MFRLYSQFIAYSRAYADAIDDYTYQDDSLVGVAISASAAITAVCDAITYGSAGARSPLIARAASTPGLSVLADPDDAEPFLTPQNPICSQWNSSVATFDGALAEWKLLDPNLSYTDMSPAQRLVMDSVRDPMEAFALEIQQLGLDSDDPTFSDIATLSAQYLRGYASAVRTYTPADNFLVLAASASSAIIGEACNAPGI
ncbi:hypothetical protein CYL16_19680 [Mycobacterium sp. EPG1]|nr:hypothetical protein CYL16_19680 [Mycobacterium sp. EPG1]